MKAFWNLWESVTIIGIPEGERERGKIILRNNDPYVLKFGRDIAFARRKSFYFKTNQDKYKEWLAYHGQIVEIQRKGNILKAAMGEKRHITNKRTTICK